MLLRQSFKDSGSNFDLLMNNTGSVWLTDTEMGQFDSTTLRVNQFWSPQMTQIRVTFNR